MSALVICARELGVDPASLKASDPWAMGTPKSMSIQALMMSRFPRIAQGLIEDAEAQAERGRQGVWRCGNEVKPWGYRNGQ